MKGFYYHETFRTIADIREQLSEVRQRKIQREHPNYQRDSDNHAELLRELENKLHRHIEYKQQYYKQLHEFNSKEPREPKEQLLRDRENQQEIQGNHANKTTRARETMLQEPNQKILTDALKFSHGISHHGGNISGGILSNHSTKQRQGIRAFTERKFATQTANRPIRQRQSAKILPTNTDQEIRRKNAERLLKQVAERFNQRNRELTERERDLTQRKEQRNREFRERQKRAIDQARESYSRISKTKQRLLEIRDRNLELERELRNAIANTQHIISQISSFRESRESRIKASDANIKTERNLAQKRFTDNVRADFTARITERSNQRARDFTSSIQRIENTIRDFRNNAQARARTILHNLYARTRDAINAIKNIYRNAKSELETSFKEQMSDFQSEWNKKQESFMQKQHNWIERLENTIKR